MKKQKLIGKLSLLLVCVLLVGTIAGCGTKNEARRDEQGRLILSVGGWPGSEGAALDAYNARKERYEKENPDVVIEPVYWSFDRQTFYSKAAGGQLPTIYMAQYTELPEIINEGYSADLTKVLKKRGYDGMFNELLVNSISDDDGNIMAFPKSAAMLGLAFNAELFEQAGLLEADGTPKQPKDWDEVVEFALKIKEATGKSGIILPTADRSGGWIFTSIAWSFGVNFMEKDADGKWKATFNTPEAVAALQWYKDLKWKYDLLPSNVIVDGEEWYKNFAVGNGAITIAAGDYTNRVKKYGMTPEQIGIMATPAGPKKHVTLLTGDIYALSNKATEEEIDAAIRWFEMSLNYKLTDSYKKSSEDAVQQRLADGIHVGVQNLSIWSQDAESLKWYNDYIEKNANANINHVRLYNEFVQNCPIEVRTEEPVCAQELYAILDNCIQNVLTDENADCKQILETANHEFQVNYLDNLNY